MHSQELGDYIGVESCIDLSSDIPEIVSRGGAAKTRHVGRGRRSDAAEFPPPIHLLSNSENHVMKRYRTSDGRLVITEEREQRHQYFQVHRSNGRLVLNLVPVGCDEPDGGGEEKLGCMGNVAADPGVEIGGGDKRTSDPPPEGAYVGVKPCGGFGVAMAGLMPAPVHTSTTF